MSRSADYGVSDSRPQFFTASGVQPNQSGAGISFKLLIAFLILLYSSAAQVYPELNAVRPAMTIAVGAIFMMIVELAMARQSFRFMWPQSYMLMGLLAVTVISTFSAIYMREAVDTTIDFAKIVLIYVVMENTITTRSRIRTVLLTLVVGGMFPAVGIIKNYATGNILEGRGAWEGTFANPNEAAYSLVILIPIIAALSIGARRWQQLALFTAMAVYLLAIYLTFSRGGLLGLFAIIGIFAWRQKSLAIRFGMVVLIALSLIVVSLFWERKEDFENISADTTVNQRIATFVAGLRMFEANPMVGVGPGCSSVAYPLYVPPEMHCGCQEMLHIHNSFIQVLSELGVLGFIPWIVFVGSALFCAWKLQKRGTINTTATGLELALWGFIVCSLSGGFGYSWFPYILVVLVVATKRVADAEDASAA